MDFFTVATSILGVLLTLASLSVAIFALDEQRRGELIRFWRKWLTVGFVVLILVNSTLGLYLFLIGPAQIVRGDIIRLMLHTFNLLAIPMIWFMAAMDRVMDARTVKRKELEALVVALTARVDALNPPPPNRTEKA